MWIDSLCTIQGSKGDWQANSSHISLFYANSILNIEALHGNDSHGGCIFGRDSTLLELLVIESSWTPSRTYEYVPPENENNFAVQNTSG